MSTPTRRPRAHRSRGLGCAHGRATVLLVLLTLAGSVATGVTPASAYWNASGSVSATAATSTLSAPVDVAIPETATGEVSVSWTPGAGGVQPAGYYVTRSDGDTTAPACGSSPTALIDRGDCTDVEVPAGEYTYVVTAVYASWRAAGAPSGTVAVTAPGVLGRAQDYSVLAAPANTIRFTDALPPTIGIDGGPAAVTKDTTPTISGVSNAPASSPVGVVVDGQSLSTTVTAGGTWTVTATELIAGRYEVVARVRAANGNGAAATQELTVEVNPPPVDLGSAASFSVLAATGVVNTGDTTMSGDLGVSPSTSVTGFPPGTHDGSLHAGDPAAAEAQADLLAALAEASSRTPHTEIAGDLGGQTFHAGVHHTTAALALTGTVTLDAEGSSGAVFVFLTDAAFDTAAASNVSLVNGAQPANVFWVAAGAIGTGANSSMSGALLSRGAITLGAETALTGQALSRDTVTIGDSTLTGVTPVPSARRTPSEELEAAETSAPPQAIVPDETLPDGETGPPAQEALPPDPQEDQQEELSEQDTAAARDTADDEIDDEATVTP